MSVTTTSSLARELLINDDLPPAEEPVAVLSRAIIDPKNNIVAKVDATGQLVNKSGTAFATVSTSFGSFSGGGVWADAGADGDGAILHLENALSYFDDLGVSISPSSTAPTDYFGKDGYVLGEPDKWLVVTHSGDNYLIPAFLKNPV